MADLPDYYTQAQISEAEAAKFKGGLDANKSDTPVSRDIYYATDSKILRVCVIDGTWININALYLLLAGGTMTGDIAMGGKKVTGLGAPAAADDALRYNRAEIRNAEIAAGAAIVYSKLALTGLIRNADIKADAAIVETKLSLDQGTQALFDKIATDIATHAALFTGLHGQIMVRKPDDQIVSNSEVLVNDEDLLIAVGANEVWLIHLVLWAISPTATPDIDYAFAVPAGGAIRGMIVFSFNAPGGINPLTTETTLAVETTEKYIQLFATYIGGGTAGNLQLQWAQNVATVEDTTMKTNSLMLCHRIA